MPSSAPSTGSRGMSEVVLRAGDVVLRRPTSGDAAEFLACVADSVTFHRGWVEPPSTASGYEAYLRRLRHPAHDGFLVRTAAGRHLVGVVNVNGITRGNLQSATLGYYRVSDAGSPESMTHAVGEVVRHCFRALGLHRVEANIQPGNDRSRAIARAVGMTQEGFSPAYLRIEGTWRDHERWAVVDPDVRT